MSLMVDIEKKLGDFCLCVSFEAQAETLALLGASGCGKSMTLKCIAGIETPDKGRIILNGRTLFDSEKKINLPPQQRKTGYLFQNYALFPHMTVAQNIACGIRRGKEEKAHIIAQNIQAFFLDGHEDHYPYQLSGGQQQRVALARILASEPEILMLDEPFSALDSYLRWQLERSLVELLTQFGSTALFVSHNRDEVYHICDRIAVMDNGKIENINEKETLFRAPRSLSAALLTGCKNVSKAKKLDAHTLLAEDWALTLTSAHPVPDDLRYVGIRAHFLQLCEPGQGANSFLFAIENVIEDPFSMLVMLRHPDNTQTGHRTQLCYQMDKQVWASIRGMSACCVSIPPDQLLLLR